MRLEVDQGAAAQAGARECNQERRVAEDLVEVMLAEGRWAVRYSADTLATFEDQPAAVAFAQTFANRRGPGETSCRVMVRFPPGWRELDASSAKL
jgi:hypothetical protein